MASGRGAKESSVLKANVEDQLHRLLTQLQDVETMRGDLDEAEYEELKDETIAQLREFQGTLKKMLDGDVSLVDSLGSIQLAIQAAVSQACKTPEVIKMFASKQPGQLRDRLAELQRAVKLGQMTRDQVTPQAVEILLALDRLGEELSPAEQNFLQQNADSAAASFGAASPSVAPAVQADLVRGAFSQ